MNKIKRNIPNALTCGNLLCGCLALVKVFEGDLVWAAYLVGIAVVFDFFDGFAARMLKVSSAIGKDLDSLADMVTFGVVPGVVLYQIIKISFWCKWNGEVFIIGDSVDLFFQNKFCGLNLMTVLPYFGFLITIFSAIRLAKFNNDTRQLDSFIGLPTPANAIFICSLPFALNMHTSFSVFVINPGILCLLACFLSYLLMAELPMFALKFKSFGWKGNEIRYSFLGLSLVLLAILKLLGIPLIIVLYVFMSMVNNFMNRSKNSVE